MAEAVGSGQGWDPRGTALLSGGRLTGTPVAGRDHRAYPRCMTRQTSSRTFAGANIKGTPAMKAPAVRNDVKKISRHAHVMGVQEFKWRWYWTIIRTLLGPKWRSFPAYVVGIARPVYGGQGIFWRAKLLRRVGSYVAPAFDFKVDTSGIMDDRWVRGVLLSDVATSIRCWYASMHNVVGADAAGDSGKRKMLMRQNLAQLDAFLAHITATGDPVVMEMDANIHPGTWAYGALMDVLDKHHARVVGEHGVEFLFVIDGRDADVVVEKHWVMTPRQYGLRTDHEVRCLDHHLAART